MTAVSARATAIVAGIVTAAVMFTLYTVTDVPSGVLKLVGGAWHGVARWGGVSLRWQPPPNTDLEQLQAMFRRRDLGAELRRDGDIVVVEVPGVSEANAHDTVAMVGTGPLEFREVIESDSVLQLEQLGLADASQRAEYGSAPAILLDEWHPEEGGGPYRDWYVRTYARDELVTVFADARRLGWQPPAHTIIGYERMSPSPEMKNRRTSWRSYFLSDVVALDGMSIANATGSYDPNTNRPIVLLDFDRAGARIFGDVTARVVGHKLAIVIDGEVRSAPVINTPIRGGRASVTMGAGDPEHQERERDALVATLRSGALPIGGKVLDWRYVPPTNGTYEWIARSALAFVAGVIVAVLAWLLVWLTKPERRRDPDMPGTGGRKRRLAWTLWGAALFIAGLALLDQPWINVEELAHIMYRGGHGGVPDLKVTSVFGLGVGPLLSAFALVEIVASIVPQLRRYRDGGPARRRRLGFAVAIVGMVFAGLQAYFITSYLDRPSSSGFESMFGYFSVLDPGMRWPTILAFVAGTACCAWIASIIGERGIGNGYAVLAIAGLLFEVFRYWWWEVPLPLSHVVPTLVIVAAIVVIARAMFGWQVRSLNTAAIPIPISGLSPLDPGAGLALVIIQILAVGITAPHVLVDLIASIQSNPTTGIAVMIVATAVWGIVFAWPGRRRAEYAKLDRQPAGANAWWRAGLLTAAALIAIHGLAHLQFGLAPEFYKLVDPLVLLVVIASLADWRAEWRARRRDLVAIWPLHDPLLVDGVAARLGDIPFFIQATRLRRLLWLFGAFAPMMVLVPRENAEQAATLMREWLEPA